MSDTNTPLQDAYERVEQWKRDYYRLLAQNTDLRTKNRELQVMVDRQNVIIDTLCKRVQGNDKT